MKSDNQSQTVGFRNALGHVPFRRHYSMVSAPIGGRSPRQSCALAAGADSVPIYDTDERMDQVVAYFYDSVHFQRRCLHAFDEASCGLETRWGL